MVRTQVCFLGPQPGFVPCADFPIPGSGRRKGSMPATPSAYLEALRQNKNDLDHLQGVWLSIAGQRPAELLIAGSLFTVRFLDGTLYMGTFELDFDQEPRIMEMRIDEGPGKHKGKVARCLYDLTGDLLRWAPGEPGLSRGPAEFPSEEDATSLCLLFRREHPTFRR